MGIPQSTPSVCCPKCGAQLKPGHAKCWLCIADARSRATAANLGKSRPIEPTGRFQYGISTLLLVITLVAILCSIIKMNPGLGIVVAILVIPALLRTCISAARSRAHGQPISSGEKAGVFATTTLMSIVVMVAAGIAAFFTFFVTFFITCFAGILNAWRGHSWVGATCSAASLVSSSPSLLLRSFG